MSSASYPFHNSAVTNAAVAIGTGAHGKLHRLWIMNGDASTRYLQIFGVTNPTVGTTAPLLSIAIRSSALGPEVIDLDNVVLPTKGAANAGISICVTTTPTGSTAPTAAANVAATYS